MTNPPLEETHSGRRLLHDAFVPWVSEMDLEKFVTLNFNRSTSVDDARHKFADLLARVDRSWLGRKWSREPPDRRTFARAVIENPATNLHIHALFRESPVPRRESVFPLFGLISKHWLELVPGGSSVTFSIYDQPGVTRYISKQLYSPGRWATTMDSHEFHRSSTTRRAK
jgi:hypothetical protein